MTHTRFSCDTARLIGLAAVTVLSALLPSCDMFKPRPSTQVLWALQTGSVSSTPVDNPTKTVRVRTVSAPAPISGTPLIYRYANGQIRPDLYNSWISPIPVLATPEVQNTLRSTGRYSGVLSPTDAGDVWAELQLSIIDASAHYELGVDKAFARISVVVTWMGGEEQDNVLRQVVVTKDVPIAGDSAQSVVEALSAAWTQALQDVVNRAPAQ